MKRIIFLFSALLAINSFACEGVFHETLQEVRALHHEGFKSEARGLMHELAHSDAFNFSPNQRECYNSVAQHVHSLSAVWVCRHCGYRVKNGPEPKYCKKCRRTNTFILEPDWYGDL